MKSSETINYEELTTCSKLCEEVEPMYSEDPFTSCPVNVDYILDEEDLPKIGEYTFKSYTGHEEDLFDDYGQLI